MSNFFQDVLQNVDQVQEDLLGPDYNYWKQIKTPSEMGMSGSGNISTLSRNISGLINYVELLVAGGGGASKVSGPMGNKFFLKTGGKCKDINSGRDVDRHIYVNNVPDGQIPFISQGLGGMQFSNFEGLVPGALSDLNVMNPFGIFQAFMMGNKPDCQPLTMETIDANNNKSQETQFVASVDIKNMSPCWFPNRTNPLTNQACRQALTSIEQAYADKSSFAIHPEIPDGILPKLFYASVGGLGIYLLYKLMAKQSKKL